MNSTICPYPGLRPFNEEESIFFKGREQQVERLVKRLEEKKFLMVNGASGDGKSSLIYAGVIPYAKAGFFKAKYNNWIVADFRPERSPLKNLTASICKQLKIEDHAKTEKELGYGFSALCDLYKASAFYIDESKAEWIKADEKEKKVLKRKGANLLVLVDQFEEFFTNPENYQNGIPSIESQKTVNLLIETYKLAAAQDLPIYVVCTMRSDYIGQCAAFRGLPEAVGYSQFFVPRLKRQEIEQVIEGPAELAGCKISKRLTQTLLNSLTDGFDQLPILQHALNQIWKAASDGAEEMELIHLAKVGGLSSKMLSIDDKNTFQKWFENIPEYKKQLLATPSLSNVLNAHANELIYKDNASLLTLKNVDDNINVKVIKVLFQSLTAFDKGRIVRRRATVGEVMDLVNDETLSLVEFNKIILSFREEGNSFIKPYLNESNEMLDKHVVLDITHESLIRNWKLVEQWVLEEVENVQTWLEIEKPLQVWRKNITNKNAFWFLTWRFSKLQKYVLSSGLFVLYNNWNKKFPVHLAWLKRISSNYTSNDVTDYHLFLKQSKWVNLWNKFQPYLFAAVMLYFIFQINAAKIKEGEIALKNEKIQKDLVVKAENNARMAILAKKDADSLRIIADKKRTEISKLLEQIVKSERDALNSKNNALDAKALLQKYNLEVINYQKSTKLAQDDAEKLRKEKIQEMHAAEVAKKQLEKYIKEVESIRQSANDANNEAETYRTEKIREATLKAKNEIEKNMTKEEREIYLNEIKLIYPQGTTFEENQYSNFKIKRVIIINGEEVNEYKKIIFSYGTYYKKNGRDITKTTFENETKSK